MAVLYETLRVKTPVPEVKWTSKHAQRLDVGGRTLAIPPETLIVPSYLYMHKHERFWGPDVQSWKPERWIGKAMEEDSQNQMVTTPSQERADSGDELGDDDGSDYCHDEVLLPPPSRGNFLGWSEGARNCPAKRFSQVEWVAILAALFRDWKVKPCLLEDETLVEAQTRVLDFIEKDTDYGGLLLQLMHPERLPLAWSSRH